jgi:hypothetical protein
MGILDEILRLLGFAGRDKPRLEATPLRLFATLLRENYSFLAGKSASLDARVSSFEAWEAAFASDSRISVLKVHEGETRPSAWLMFGGRAAAGLRDAYLRSRSGEGSEPGGDAGILAELAAVDLLAEGLGEAFAAEGASATLGYDLAEPGAFQLYRWMLRDCRFLEFSLEAGTLFLAIDPEAYEALLSRLLEPGFMEELLGRSRPASAIPGSGLGEASGAGTAEGGRGAGIGRIRNEELKIEGGRDFPLASLLAPRRLELPFGEAKVLPKHLLICADSSLLADRAASGYRVLLKFSSAAHSVEVPLRFLASGIGTFEPGSEEWRALLRAAAARSASSLARLFKLEVAASAAAPTSPDEALSQGPVSAISYDVSLGGARGRMALAFGTDFLALAASRLFGPDEAERLRLSSRNLFLAIESLNARIASASLAGYRRSLASAPAVAAGVASRLPVAGRPLYAILEELREKDIAAILGKLAQKGFLRREDRYSLFMHSAGTGTADGRVLLAATPCEDYESLFARFPKRWEEADGPRPRMFPAFGSLEELLEAHYDAAWLLYRELLADRLALSGTGEAVLRASGEAFAARLREALEEQGRELEALIRGLPPEARNSLPWADRARELSGLSEAAGALAPSIGGRAAEALREAIAAVDARLAEGREDAYELWKARRAFAAELRERRS